MDRRITKTRRAILDAYQELFLEKDSAKITISEIARKANIDRKTFYLHYDSVDCVRHELIKENLTNFVTFLTENGYYENPFDAAAFFQYANRFLEQHMEMTAKIATHPDFDFFWSDVKNIFAEGLVKGLAQTSMLSETELNVYARFLTSGIIDLYTSYLKKEISIPLDEMGRITGELISKLIQEQNFSHIPKTFEAE